MKIDSIEIVVTESSDAKAVRLLRVDEYDAWLSASSTAYRNWLSSIRFEAKAGSTVLLPGMDGELDSALAIVEAKPNLWDVARLHAGLPEGRWKLIDPQTLLEPSEACLGWALNAYRYGRYKSSDKERPKTLVLRDVPSVHRSLNLATSMYLCRDLVNTPANDLGPEELDDAVQAVARAYGAKHRSIVGEALLESGYPTIHAVGRASTRAPRLIELRWGAANAPKLTLVGKGVCFDTGGLDIKPSSNMLLMKKDMGGAALMLGLASAIVANQIPVDLRLLIPAVENSISGSAFRPGDVLRTRKGLSVEIGNTDAEGRLVLADALTDADMERPAMILDAATLTGAARVALGPDLPALFAPDSALAEDLLHAAELVNDPLWRLPLHQPYRRYLESPIADINNTGSKPFGGSITAALFLERFVTETKAWAHLDIFAWNDESRPGRPRGGEATAFRALYAMIERRFMTHTS